MKEFLLRELERAVRRRDVELPGQIRRRAERLLVEEIAPASDGLPQSKARRSDVHVGDGGQPLPQGIPAAHEQAPEDTAVYGEPALPDREDLRSEERRVGKECR